MKRIVFNIIWISLFAFVFSCDVLDTNEDPNGYNLEGTWKCDETSSTYKSTMNYYNIYIEPNPSDSLKIYIYNFYQLGNDIEVNASISGHNLTIRTQSVGDGFTVSGNGTIASNLKTIEVSYLVDDGSGSDDNVTATLTYLY